MEYPQDVRYTRAARMGSRGGRADQGGHHGLRPGRPRRRGLRRHPEVGAEVRAGEPFGEVESTKSVSDVYAPVSGTVVERNDELTDTPELVNSDPFGQGWMILIEVAEPADLEGLLDAGAYRSFTDRAIGATECRSDRHGPELQVRPSLDQTDREALTLARPLQ